MNLQELLQSLQDLCLSHKQIVSVQVGNTFDVGQGKAEKYPVVWIETPFLIDYNDKRKKTFTFALNFLSLCKYDDLLDVVLKTSDMEIVSDDILQAIDNKYTTIGIADVTGLTLKNFSDDDLVGVRTELTFMVGRDCDWRNNFDKAL